ncbi:hypothetical protein GCM10010124_23850 [Pilimelia terevasa]|uniref:PDZ domain-containing protein n=1 Tax=Pilimelia terevasa TaxID=53372 RepID=A0A8J3BLJ1_9ACTN|nr:trypsin-like peptidase domain-containing protein [Pilimelia terevasa]GGK30308.1 hypothetical protein GCM10010124_23850 [Pilimelia terevasa]
MTDVDRADAPPRPGALPSADPADAAAGASAAPLPDIAGALPLFAEFRALTPGTPPAGPTVDLRPTADATDPPAPALPDGGAAPAAAPAPAATGAAAPAGIAPAWLGAVVVVALAAGFVGGAAGYLGARGATGALLGDRSRARTPAPGSVAAAVAAVRPSVVTVRTTDADGANVGSGFLLSGAGHVLTNDHVLGTGAGTVQVTLAGGAVTGARVVGVDREADLAVLQVQDARGRRPARLGDPAALAVGDPVLAFGSPLALTDTVTAGIVSALDRPLRTGGDAGEQVRYYAAIQTDAAVNQGNSGGPLVDAAGRVVGVNAVIQSVAGRQEAGSIGLAFAIPIDQARRVAGEIIASGSARRTVFGADVTDVVGSPGVQLGAVAAGGPARRAGLRAGDIVTRLDGRALEGAVDLIALVRRRAPGEAVSVGYDRGALARTVSVRLAAGRG